MLIKLEQPLMAELSGSDAAKVLHNLTTNQVQTLAVGKVAETFITDVRGWVVAHGIVFHVEADRYWLMGQHPDTDKVCSHIDRYIIREDALVKDRSAGACLWVHLPDQADSIGALASESTYRVPFPTFDPSAELVVTLGTVAGSHAGIDAEAAIRWDQERIPRFWPRMGVDVWDKCIPQELDRTQQAICFTKGCYLGQETIARLDSLGQIQKKLCRLRWDGASVAAGTSVFSGEKEVGTVFSSTEFSGVSWALAVIRRGFFEAGTTLSCNGFSASVT